MDMGTINIERKLELSVTSIYLKFSKVNGNSIYLSSENKWLLN